MQPTRPPVPFATWGRDGPPVVYDGVGLETDAGPPVLDVPCPRCEAAVRVDVVAVLDAAAVDADDPATAAHAETLGLVVHEPMPGFRVVTDPLGLRAHRLVRRCPACGAAFAALVGYGEFQPARWVATFLGLVPVPR